MKKLMLAIFVFLNSFDASALTCNCYSPPASTFGVTCVAPTQFTMYPGGKCNTICDATTGACDYKSKAITCPTTKTSAYRLPQDSDWQVVLRAWMAQRVASDYALPSGSAGEITAQNLSGLTEDELFRMIIMSKKDAFRNIPNPQGLQLKPEKFLLSEIETLSSGQPHARAGSGAMGMVQPIPMLFFYKWNYAGNPYYNRPAVLRRAFAVASADMMRSKQCYDSEKECASGEAKVSLSTIMRDIAYVDFIASKDSVIDSCTLAAYKQGVRSMFSRFKVRITGKESDPNSNWLLAGLHAMETIKTLYPDLATDASVLSSAMINKNCNVAGFCWHQLKGFDPSYEGRTIERVLEAYTVNKNADLKLWLERFSKMKSYLTVRDGTNPKMVGPTHFAPATSPPSGEDQNDYHSYARDMLIAQYTTAGRYLAFGGRGGYPTTIPDKPTMINQLMSDLPKLKSDRAWGCWTGSTVVTCDRATDAIDLWQVRHYPTTLTAGVTAYQNGMWQNFRNLQGTASTILPAERPNAMLEFMGDTAATNGIQFAAAKIKTIKPMWVIISTNEVDHSGTDSGFGGGAISMIWTLETGPIWLGVNRGHQSTDPVGFEWSDFENFPTHAVTGSTKDDLRFSSARLTKPTVSGTKSGVDGTIVVSGNLKTQNNRADLSSDLNYKRTFTISSSTGLLRVKTELSAAANLPVKRLFESIPIYQGTSETSPATPVEAKVAGVWQNVDPGSRIFNATDIRITRVTDGKSGSLLIALKSPRDIELSGDKVTAGPAVDQVLKIHYRSESDEVQSANLGSVNLEYTISTN